MVRSLARSLPSACDKTHTYTHRNAHRTSPPSSCHVVRAAYRRVALCCRTAMKKSPYETPKVSVFSRNVTAASEAEEKANERTSEPNDHRKQSLRPRRAERETSEKIRCCERSDREKACCENTAHVGKEKLTSRFLASVSLFRDGPNDHVATCFAYPRACLYSLSGLSASRQRHIAILRSGWSGSSHGRLRCGGPRRERLRETTATTTARYAERSGRRPRRRLRRRSRRR